MACFDSDPRMAEGTLEVKLFSAKDLNSTDFLSGGDPYAILTCRTQERKSSVLSGTCPVWNETFSFNISSGVNVLKIKLMDEDTFTADDTLGEATISLETVFAEGRILPMSYNVVKGDQYCGEVRVGLQFTHQRSRDREFCDEGENIGGWKQSSLE